MLAVHLAALRFAGGAMSGPVHGARASWAERRGLVIEVAAGAGALRGLGEASPLPGYSPDALDDCAAALEAAFAGGPIELRPERGVADVSAALQRIGAALPAARFALECALLDLAGRALGCPLRVLLGADPPRAEVPLCALLPGAHEATGQIALEQGLARGVRRFKLKVGRADFADDLIYIEALARRLPPDAALRLDANRSWPARSVCERLAALAHLPIEFVEEPGAHLSRRGGLPRERRPALAADESLAGAADTERDATLAAVEVAVLKPALLGGLLAARALAARAATHGVDSVVSHLFDGPVALAACAELALALPSATGHRAAGLDRHAGLAAWPDVPVPQVGRAALFPAPVSGLGVSHLF